MFKLLDRTFWRFASGFVMILIFCFSVLTISGIWRESKGNFAAVISSIRGGE